MGNIQIEMLRKQAELKRKKELNPVKIEQKKSVEKKTKQVLKNLNFNSSDDELPENDFNDLQKNVEEIKKAGRGRPKKIKI